LRAGILEPDKVRGKPLDMDQYSRLFGTARIPTQVLDFSQPVTIASDPSVYAEGLQDAGEPRVPAPSYTAPRPILFVMVIWVTRTLTFCLTDWFDVLDDENQPVLTEREVLRNLQAIVADADKTPISEVALSAIGVLSTENRKTWSNLRTSLSKDRTNSSCLQIMDNALFVVCLDDAAPGANLSEMSCNFLCGTYDLKAGVQIGTCTNRWYDKVCFWLVQHQ
jgi:carnitine O-acetyltransferase